MALKIKFNEESFEHKDEQNPTFDKPDYKKFNMRFNNLDLIIIDAIAKREGVSRSQIINDFIEDSLKKFVMAVNKDDSDQALLITDHAEFLSRNSTKLNKNFSWDLWLGSYFYHPQNYLNQAKHTLNEMLEEGAEGEDLKNLKQILDRNKTLAK